jgi:hypothetical protein
MMNGKKRYDVFVFVPEALTALVSTADKMSVVVLAGVETTTDITADNESAEMSAKRKRIEGSEYKEDDRNNKNSNKENRSQPPSTLAAVAPKQMTGEEMAEAFGRLFDSPPHQGSQSVSTPEGSKEGN